MQPPTRYVAALAATFVLAGAAPAAADSIAYVKDGNVWLSTSDASRQYQVTSTGGYSDVTQADDGTMIALNGVRLHRLNREGKVLADFDTPVSDTRPAGSRVFFGPYDPAVSPDGSKLAYTYYYMTQSQSPTCFPPECVTTINEGGTGYSHADRQTAWDEPGLGKHSGWRHPIWVDEDTTVLSNPTHLPNSDVIVDTISDGGTGNLVKNWFTDTTEGNVHVGGGDVSRDRRKLAFQTGANDSTLSVYHVASFPTAFKDGEADPSTYPAACYRYSDAPGGKFSQPTFSPDGARLAWAAGDGIHVAAVPDFGGGCTLAGATPTPPLAIAGATEPDWGPADVPAARSDVGSQGGQAGAGGKADPKAKVMKTRLKVALRQGLRVRVTVPKAGRLGATASRKGRTVAKAPAKRVAAGKRTLVLRFNRAAKRSLRRSKATKLTIRVAYTPRGGTRQVTTLAAKLKR